MNTWINGKNSKLQNSNWKLLTAIDMLMMVRKSIREKIYQGIHRYRKANSKYMADYDKTKKSSHLCVQ